MIKRAVSPLLFLLLFAVDLGAYYFGKNKVQYRDFDWYITSTEHFDIYYYEGGEDLARFASAVLEEAYGQYSNFLQMQPEGKIPVLIYNCQKDFLQTNVTLELLEESVGGFTEIFKNRVVVPFNGSYYDFWHVLRHELTHVFQFYIYYRKSTPSLTGGLRVSLPLWVVEGMAEYFSLGWDQTAETFMRDLVINEQLVHLYDLENYGGYLIYKEGQSFYYFVEKVYGREKVREFIYQLRFKKDVSRASRKVFGKEIEDLDKDFRNFLKRRYYPLLGEFSMPADLKRLTDHEKSGGFMNVAPTLSPDGKAVAIVSDRKGNADVLLISSVEGKVLKRLVKGESSADFEYLHLFRPGLAFSPDGNKLAVLSLGRGRELLHILDVRKGKSVRKFELDLDAAYDPAWSPDGSLIALSGVKGGEADIYLLHLGDGTLERVTEDRFDDRAPSFSKDGSALVFVSDRAPGRNQRFGSYALFLFDLRDGGIKELTPHLGQISGPRFLDDTTILFVAPYRGSLNLALYRIGGDSLYFITDLLTAVSHPSLDVEGEKLVFSLTWEGGYDVFEMKSPFRPKFAVPLREIAPREIVLPEFLERKRNYVLDFSVDWLRGNMQFSTYYGLFGAMTVGLSDALGNHRIMFTSDLYQDISNSNFEFLYLYLPRRTDYGFSFYQFWTFYVYPYDLIITEKRLGAELLLRYPFDKFRRAEFGLAFLRPKRYYYYYFPEYDQYLLLHQESKNVSAAYLGLVLDNSFYTYFGPISGTRAFVGVEKSLWSQLEYMTLYADLRKYFRITERSCFALRFIGGRSSGKNAQPFWLGGPEDLRGYDYYEFSGTRKLLTNLELRVPFLDYLKLSFPLPLEIGNVRGVCFFDVGAAWSCDRDFKPFDGFKFRDLKADFGIGLRLLLGFFSLKFDMAKKTDLSRVYPGTRYYLTLGTDF